MKPMMLNPREGIAKFLGLSLFCVLFFGVSLGGQPGLNEPVKISVKSKVEGVDESGTASVLTKIVLMNAKNEIVETPKNLKIQIEVYSSTGRRIEEKSLDFRVGEESKKVTIPIKERGILEIRATQKELLSGGTFISVRSPKVQLQKPLKKQVQKPPPKPLKKPLLKPLKKQVQKPLKKPTQEPTQEPPIEPRITMMYSPQRGLLADGKDAAEIQAFYIGEQTPHSEISVVLYNDLGALDPKALRILEDEIMGSSTLTSKETGEITVEYTNLNPHLIFEGQEELKVLFRPPITSFKIKASPPIISLEDKAELVVQLLDNNEKLIETDEPRDFSFTKDKGRGVIKETKQEIAKGEFECRTVFEPTWPGKVQISATTPGLFDKTVQIEIKFPWQLLLISVFGGLIGGMVFWVIRLKLKASEWPKIIVGIVTGYLLYWAVSFGLLVGLKFNYLNMLSVFSFSFIGGYFSEEVINLIWKILVPNLKDAR